MFAKTDRVGIVRDMNNQALLSSDVNVLQAHREEFQRKRDFRNKLNDINIMKEQIQELLSLRDEMQEIKNMLKIHIQRDNQWQV
jgi:hypothetical protein